MLVALDTNILFTDLWLTSRDMKTLLEFLRIKRGKILLFEVVDIEVEARFIEDCEKNLRKTERYIQNLPTESEATLEWRNNFEQKLNSDILERVPLDDSILRDTVYRLAKRIPPSSSNGEQFRDVVLWLGLLKYAQTITPQTPIILISEDSDFRRQKDGNSLHPILQKEITDLGLDIRYCRNIQEFIKKEGIMTYVESDVFSGGIELTDGFLSVPGYQRGPRFKLIGPYIIIINDGGDPGNVHAWRCSPCEVGTQISLGSYFVGSLTLGFGPANIQGRDYPHIFYSGIMNFGGAEKIVISKDTGNQIEGGFTFTATIRGYTKNPFIGDPGKAVFDVELKGKGTATLELGFHDDARHGRLYDFRSLTYRFH
jgi:PIN domain